mgnify:FL=1
MRRESAAQGELLSLTTHHGTLILWNKSDAPFDSRSATKNDSGSEPTSSSSTPLGMVFCQSQISVRCLMTMVRMIQTRNYDVTLSIFNQDQVLSLALVAITAIMLTFFQDTPRSGIRVWLRLGFRIRILVLVDRDYLLRPESDLRKSQACPAQAIFAVS